jgi:hypothetical protein
MRINDAIILLLLGSHFETQFWLFTFDLIVVFKWDLATLLRSHIEGNTDDNGHLDEIIKT